MSTPESTRGTDPGRLRVVHRLACLVAALMAVAAAAGLLAPEVYRDNALVTAGWFGTDLVTLVVGVPLLALAIWRSAAGSRPWRLVLLGMLLYALYGYAFYLFGASFNALFLVYVAIVAASAFALLPGIAALAEEHAVDGVPAGGLARAVAAFMLLVGVLLGGFWTALSLAFVATGEPPAMVAATAHPTNVTGALDLSIVVPLALVGGWRLWQGRAWGYLLAVVWNVKGAVYMLALSAASVSAYTAGAVRDLMQLALWLPIALGCLLATVVLLRGRGSSPVEEIAPHDRRRIRRPITPV